MAGRGRWCRTPRDGGRSPRPGCERPGEPGKQRRATDSARGPRKAGAPPTPILTSGTLKLRAVLGHCVRELCYSNSRSLIQKKEQVLFKMPQIPDSLAARGGRLLAMDVKQMGTGRGLQEGHCSAAEGRTEGAGFSPPTQPACHVSSFLLGTQGETGAGQPHAEDRRARKTGKAGHCYLVRSQHRPRETGPPPTSRDTRETSPAGLSLDAVTCSQTGSKGLE